MTDPNCITTAFGGFSTQRGVIEGLPRTCVREPNEADVGDGSHFQMQQTSLAIGAFLGVIRSPVLIRQKTGVAFTKQKVRKQESYRNSYIAAFLFFQFVI